MTKRKFRRRMRKLAEAIRNTVDLQDVFVFGGLACAAFGAAQVYEPAAWMLVGVAVFWLGVRR